MYTEIREWTTAKERMDIAAKHGVKTRAQVSNIIRGTSVNIPLLEALLAKAEENKAKADELKERSRALQP